METAWGREIQLLLRHSSAGPPSPAPPPSATEPPSVLVDFQIEIDGLFGERARLRLPALFYRFVPLLGLLQPASLCPQKKKKGAKLTILSIKLKYIDKIVPEFKKQLLQFLNNIPFIQFHSSVILIRNELVCIKKMYINRILFKHYYNYL